VVCSFTKHEQPENMSKLLGRSTITGRGGLALFSRYLEMIGIFDILNSKFSILHSVVYTFST
jgi:hypothetical protein